MKKTCIALLCALLASLIPAKAWGIAFPDFATEKNPAVEAALEAGIARGYNDGTFRPEAPLSRQAYGLFLARLACANGDIKSPSTISDSTALMLPAMARLQDGNPMDPITWDEACIWAVEVMGREVSCEETSTSATMTRLDGLELCGSYLLDFAGEPEMVAIDSLEDGTSAVTLAQALEGASEWDDEAMWTLGQFLLTQGYEDIEIAADGSLLYATVYGEEAVDVLTVVRREGEAHYGWDDSLGETNILVTPAMAIEIFGGDDALGEGGPEAEPPEAFWPEGSNGDWGNAAWATGAELVEF